MAAFILISLSAVGVAVQRKGMGRRLIAPVVVCQIAAVCSGYLHSADPEGIRLNRCRQRRSAGNDKCKTQQADYKLFPEHKTVPSFRVWYGRKSLSGGSTSGSIVHRPTLHINVKNGEICKKIKKNSTF